MDVNHQNEWKNCISLDGVHLPTGYYLGISAATGDLTGKFYFVHLYSILTWSHPGTHYV